MSPNPLKEKWGKKLAKPSDHTFSLLTIVRRASSDLSPVSCPFGFKLDRTAVRWTSAYTRGSSAHYRASAPCIKVGLLIEGVKDPPISVYRLHLHVFKSLYFLSSGPPPSWSCIQTLLLLRVASVRSLTATPASVCLFWACKDFWNHLPRFI